MTFFNIKPPATLSYDYRQPILRGKSREAGRQIVGTLLFIENTGRINKKRAIIALFVNS